MLVFLPPENFIKFRAKKVKVFFGRRVKKGLYIL